MNILILNWRDIKHPLAGGAEISLMEQAKYWRKRGENVVWFSSSFPKSKAVEKIDGIKIIRKGSHYTVHIHAFLHYMKGKFKDIDVVIDSFHFIPFFTPLYIRRKIIALINEPAGKLWFKNIPYLFAFIGYYSEPLFFKFYKNIQFITGSESIANELKDSYSISDKNISVVHHGFSSPSKNKIFKKEKNPTVIFASRLSEDKGIEKAIEAVAKIKAKVPSIQFWVVGKSENEDYLKKIKKTLQKSDLHKNTTLFGFVSEKKKFELFQKAWILIHPSFKEGWGLNVIEANSVGTPAVGYNVTGLTDSIKNGITGLIAKKNESDELVYLVLKFIEDSNLRTKLSENAKKWSEKFSWEKSGKASLEIIKRIYEKK